MSGTSAERRAPLDAVAGWLAGWPFAVAALAALATATGATLAMLAWPPGESAVAAFAGEFRRWCFGREATGLDAGALFATTSAPVVLGALVAGFWRGPLRDAWRQRAARVVALGAASALAVLASGVLLFASQETPARAAAALPFPADALRTSIPAPPLALPDHLGGTTDLAELRGRVVVITAIYARCSTACPMILAESRRLLDALNDRERASVTLVGLTLDPEHDSRARLAEIAEGYGLGGDVRLLTGEPAQVERALDRFGFERRRDPLTGRIDHAGFFVIVDRDGRIAYRIAASSAQDHWLPEAVRELIAEPAPAAPAG